MTEDVLYTTQWNDMTRRPAMRHQWLSEVEARTAYDSASALEIVDAVHRDSDGNPIPRWVIGAGTSGRVRVRFFTPGGSVWRSTDYDVVDGRLWRWICRTFIYPDQETRYERTQATRVIKEKFLPDRTGSVQFDERDEVLHTAKITDAPVDGFWLDRPAFGEWADLSNPEYGVPADTDWPAAR